MKKNHVQMICANLFLLLLTAAAFYGMWEVPASRIRLEIVYGESHDQDGGTAQFFWAEGDEGFSEERSKWYDIDANDFYAAFWLPDIDLENAYFRLDPVANGEPFTIDRIEISVDGRRIGSIWAEELAEELVTCENVEWAAEEKTFIPQTADPIFYLGDAFNEKLMTCWREDIYSLDNMSAFILMALLVVWLEAGMLLYERAKAGGTARRTKKSLAGLITADVVLCLGAALVYGVAYLRQQFAGIRLVELLYYANTQLQGTNMSTFAPAIRDVAAIVVGISLLVAAGNRLLCGERKQKGYSLWIAAFGVVSTVYAVALANEQLDIISYMKLMSGKTKLYEEHYVSADDVTITFPEEKRNLIYIFLESMEMTYADTASGGAMEENYIPGLTELAMENIDFSDEESLNGAYTPVGTTFTTGGMVAQTAGIPINTLYMDNSAINEWKFGDDYLLQGAVSLGDLLEEQGYRQVLMLGSDAAFGAREAYFKGHGSYAISDYDTAIEEGKIPADYKEWWGYEDTKLIEYAKEELLSLAEDEEPFDFVMLTADTHFTDGYVCRKCREQYGDQYSNVIACSDRQISEFVEWISEQDFYENTTIVIAGDHLTMDSDYIGRQGADSFDRRTYVTIINPAENCKEPVGARRYSTLDLYPTTLAALGADIEGDRLGLGANLFSEEPTLYEMYEQDYLDAEFQKKSKFYANDLFYKKTAE